MPKVETIRGKLSEVNPALLKEIKDMISPSYVDTTSLLEREDQHCRTTYVLRDANNELSAFFMINYEDLEGLASVYLGLCGVSEKYKNSGIVSILLIKSIEDCLNLQEELSQKLVLYATTPTPSIYNIISKLWQNQNPKIDGSYSAESKKIADLFCAKYQLATKGHPFVLKGAAPNTFYSKTENERIQQIITKHKFDLFDRLDVREEEGDRLLVTIELPTREKFESLANEYTSKAKV